MEYKSEHLKILPPVPGISKIASVDTDFDQVINNPYAETSAGSTRQSQECLRFEKNKDPFTAVNSVYQDAFFEKIRVEMKNQISTVANKLMPRKIYLTERFNYTRVEVSKF